MVADCRPTVVRCLFLGEVWCSRRSVLEAGPRLVRTDEMDSINLVPISSVRWGISVGGGWSDIVSIISQAQTRATRTHVKDNRFHSPPPPSSENHSFNRPWSAPSKLPFPPLDSKIPWSPSPVFNKPCNPIQSLSRGRMTMTPELKQSGHPVSEQADRT